MDELDLHQWESQYRRLQSVEELSHKNHLIEVFEKEYERKMGARPVWDLGNSHLALMADIQKLGRDKTADLIKHFFHMRDDWFAKQGYTLQELKRNISKIHADYIKRGRPHNSAGGEIRILTEVSCDKCHKQYMWTGTPKELLNGSSRHCKDCK